MLYTFFFFFFVFPGVWLQSDECIHSMQKERPTKGLTKSRKDKIQKMVSANVFTRRLTSEWAWSEAESKLVYAFLVEMAKCVLFNS